jgi:SsrA-binding protein
MARPRPLAFDKQKIVAENRRARFDYAIEDKYEAGIALTGTEVKSLRFGEGSIAESYAEVKDGEVWLVNANIPEFSHGNRFNHEPKRPRKLLLTSREINKMFGAVMRQGMTLVPLSIYFNGRGRAKVELAIAKGRKAHDKREYEQEKDWKREQGRLMRQHGWAASRGGCAATSRGARRSTNIACSARSPSSSPSRTCGTSTTGRCRAVWRWASASASSSRSCTSSSRPSSPSRCGPT